MSGYVNKLHLYQNNWTSKLLCNHQFKRTRKHNTFKHNNKFKKMAHKQGWATCVCIVIDSYMCMCVFGFSALTKQASNTLGTDSRVVRLVRTRSVPTVSTIPMLGCGTCHGLIETLGAIIRYPLIQWCVKYKYFFLVRTYFKFKQLLINAYIVDIRT